MKPENEDARAAPIALWRIVGAFITTLFNLFGSPAEIAARHTFTAKQSALLLAWLRAGEALMRRMLLIEAAALAATPSPKPGMARSVRQRRLIEFQADNPEDWRVSFRCFTAYRGLPAGKCGAGRLEAGGTTSRFHSAWPLAERAEALLRVFNAPARYAVRLARRIWRKVARLAALLRAPDNAPDLVGRESYAVIHDAAADAARVFNSS